MSWKPWLRDCLIKLDPEPEKKPLAVRILDRSLFQGKEVEIPKLGVKIKPQPEK